MLLMTNSAGSLQLLPLARKSSSKRGTPINSEYTWCSLNGQPGKKTWMKAGIWAHKESQPWQGYHTEKDQLKKRLASKWQINDTLIPLQQEMHMLKQSSVMWEKASAHVTSSAPKTKKMLPWLNNNITSCFLAEMCIQICLTRLFALQRFFFLSFVLIIPN